MTPLDILAIAAHRDDVEQTCGGTLLKMAECGYRTGILDLTRGEMGTRGSAEDREREAADRYLSAWFQSCPTAPPAPPRLRPRRTVDRRRRKRAVRPDAGP